MRRHIANGTITLTHGDITCAVTQAIVTAANAALCGGGGVDGAVHAAAGPGLLEALRGFGSCPTGDAVITDAFELLPQGVRHIIHAVGPIWHDGTQGEEALLRTAYERSVELAEQHDLASIALPSISTGIYGFPIARAAPIAIDTCAAFLRRRPAHLHFIEFFLFDELTARSFSEALEAAADPA